MSRFPGAECEDNEEREFEQDCSCGVVCRPRKLWLSNNDRDRQCFLGGRHHKLNSKKHIGSVIRNDATLCDTTQSLSTNDNSAISLLA